MPLGWEVFSWKSSSLKLSVRKWRAFSHDEFQNIISIKELVEGKTVDTRAGARLSGLPHHLAGKEIVIKLTHTPPYLEFNGLAVGRASLHEVRQCHGEHLSPSVQRGERTGGGGVFFPLPALSETSGSKGRECEHW